MRRGCRRPQKFLAAAVTSPDADTAWLKVDAASGLGAKQLRAVRISVDEDTAEGRGLVGEAYRRCRSAISNHFLSDERTRPWHDSAGKAGVASSAAIPIVRDGRAIGVMPFHSRIVNAFSDDIIAQGYDYRVGEDNRNLQTPEMAAVVFKAFNEVHRSGDSKSGQHWQYLHRNGSVIHVEGSVLLVKDESDVIMQRVARHDSLPGLPPINMAVNLSVRNGTTLRR